MLSVYEQRHQKSIYFDLFQPKLDSAKGNLVLFPFLRARFWFNVLILLNILHNKVFYKYIVLRS